MNDRKMGNIGTTSGSNPVIVHGIFNNNVQWEKYVILKECFGILNEI